MFMTQFTNMKPLAWRDLRWENLEALSVPLIDYAGQQWIPLREFAAALGVPASRLTNAARSKLNLGRVSCVSLLGQGKKQLAISRATLTHLVHRIQPGSHNQLLRLVHVAERISHPQLSDDFNELLRQHKLKTEKLHQREEYVHARRRKKETVLRLLATRFDNGQPIEELEAEWVRETGLKCSTLRRLLRVKPVKPNQNFKPRSVPASKAPRKRPVLTTATLVEIQKLAASGWTVQRLANGFNRKSQTIKEIIAGTYSTQASAVATKPAYTQEAWFLILMDATKHMQRKELAALLRVSPSQLSQVLNSSGKYGSGQVGTGNLAARVLECLSHKQKHLG